MNLSLTEIAKKHRMSYSSAFRKMRNHKPVTGGYGRKYSEDSVDAAFKNEAKEIVDPVGVRKWDCKYYPDCLTSAAKLSLEKMDCGTCKKYESERD